MKTNKNFERLNDRQRTELNETFLFSECIFASFDLFNNSVTILNDRGQLFVCRMITTGIADYYQKDEFNECINN